jgi:hypothetical protein
MTGPRAAGVDVGRDTHRTRTRRAAARSGATPRVKETP